MHLPLSVCTTPFTSLSLSLSAQRLMVIHHPLSTPDAFAGSHRLLWRLRREVGGYVSESVCIRSRFAQDSAGQFLSCNVMCTVSCGVVVNLHLHRVCVACVFCSRLAVYAHSVPRRIDCLNSGWWRFESRRTFSTMICGRICNRPTSR